MSLNKKIDKRARRVYQEVLKEALEDKVLNSVFEARIIRKLLMFNSASFQSYIEARNIDNKKNVLNTLIKYRNKNFIKQITEAAIA